MANLWRAKPIKFRSVRTSYYEMLRAWRTSFPRHRFTLLSARLTFTQGAAVSIGFFQIGISDIAIRSGAHALAPAIVRIL